METLTANKANQERLKGDYMVFRTNFVAIWLTMNAACYIIIVQLMQAGLNSTVIKVFLIYMALWVVFRFLFASVYILVWKFRFNFDGRYKIRRVNLTKDFKEINE